MTNATFTPYGKTPRLNRPIVVTEKIDGTNAGIRIVKDRWINPALWDELRIVDSLSVGGTAYTIYTQSRNRIITPNRDGQSTDNAGFSAWVYEHAETLVRALGPGMHFGEWYGNGIQRGYGLDEKRFALFNPDRDPDLLQGARAEGCAIETVPVLYRGRFDQDAIVREVELLAERGSVVAGAEGFKAEGVIVYHTASRVAYKVMCEDDHLPKTVAEALREAA